MTPVIVGQGAIGSLLAARCELKNIEYKVLVRSNKPGPIHFISPETTRGFTPLSMVRNTLSNKHLLILPVKAYQVQTSLTPLLPQLKQHKVPVMLLHNGMGTSETIAQLLPHNPLLAATTSYGVFKQATQVKQTGIGPTYLGWVQNPVSEVEQWLNDCFSKLLPPTNWQSQIAHAQWQKLAINAVINPITAIEKIRNGALQEAKYQPQIFALCDEIATVMSQVGIKTDANTLQQKILQVCQATAANYSSMHQDIYYQRKTEIDFINGYLQQQAQRYTINTPINEALVRQIKFLENQATG